MSEHEATRPWTVHGRRVLHEGVCRVEEHDVETPDGPPLRLPGDVHARLREGAAGDRRAATWSSCASTGTRWAGDAGAAGGRHRPGRGLEAAARRELAEETALAPGALEHLGAFNTAPGRIDERGWIFLATDCVPDPAAVPDEPTEPVHVPAARPSASWAARCTTPPASLALLLARDRLLPRCYAPRRPSATLGPWTTG